jgi:hypothetical protein
MMQGYEPVAEPEMNAENGGIPRLFWVGGEQRDAFAPLAIRDRRPVNSIRIRIYNGRVELLDGDRHKAARSCIRHSRQADRTH